MVIRTKERGKGWLVLSALVVVGIVMFWRGALSDHEPPAESLAPANPLPDAEPTKSALVRGTDTEFERVPLSPSNVASASVQPDETSQERATLVITLAVGKERIHRGWIEIGRDEGGSIVDVRSRTVDPGTGEARFEGLPFGRYVVSDLQQLPRGCSGPLSKYDFPQRPSRLVNADFVRLEIPLAATTRVFGYLRDADGEPLDAPIRFTYLDDQGRKQPAPRLVPVVKGYYQADLGTGLWLAETTSPGGKQGDLEAPPEPKLLRLDLGSATRADFTLERGSGVIEGRVLDENGAAFAGLTCAVARVTSQRIPDSDRVLRFESRVFETESSTDGSFRAKYLAQGRYVILVDARKFNPFARPGENRVGGGDHGTEVDVSNANSVRAEIVLRRSRPVELQVEIEVAPEWRKENGVPTLWPAIRFVSDDTFADGSQVRHTIGATEGRFRQFVEAELRSPRFELELGKTTATYPVAIPAGVDVVPLVLRFPQ